MSRIAIVGSCITRDLWPIRGGGADQLLYVSRSSLPSLLADPVAGFQPSAELPGGLHQHEHNALVADLRKTALCRLLAFKPTHIIFDLIDERFDLLAAGGGLANHSSELVRSGYLSQPAFADARPIPRLSAGCERLWLEAASEFAAIVRTSVLGRAKLILHSARWAHQQRTPDGEVHPVVNVEILTGRPGNIDDYNAVLQRQEAAFDAVMPPMTRVDASAFRMAETEHRWGLSPFHYVPEYYEEIRRQLRALGLKGVFSRRPAAPSIRAA